MCKIVWVHGLSESRDGECVHTYFRGPLRRSPNVCVKKKNESLPVRASADGQLLELKGFHIFFRHTFLGDLLRTDKSTTVIRVFKELG